MDCGCSSTRLVLLVVAMALLLDGLMFSSFVPIIPAILYSLKYPENSTDRPSLSNYTTSAPFQDSEAAITPTSGSSSRSRNPQQNQTSNSSCCQIDGELLRRENFEVGVLLGSKTATQLLTNPLVGPLTNRIGFHIPICTGFVIMFVASLMFAFAQSYALLLVARLLQGVGSSFSSVAGLGLLATVFLDDVKRGQAMGVALGGLGLGVLCGGPFASVMYEFVGTNSPFLALAALALLGGALQFCILKPTKISPESIKGTAFLTLLRDPYILLAAGALCMANMVMTVLETTLPIWMIMTMSAPQWKIGLFYVPGCLAYLISTNLFGKLGERIGRWLCAGLGMILMGIIVCCIPLAKDFASLMGPSAGVGFFLGMAQVSVVTILGHLVDIRHVSVYGSVYAIGDMAVCLAYTVGPLAGGALVPAVGFSNVQMIFGTILILFAPLCIFLRNPPTTENRALVDQEVPPGSSDVDKDHGVSTE
ncbi:unnamed protein product [Knipowitschia caucasica]|uniref:Major facilitator superfamily (MFS) profile domain-containing protein n=1 Tax=Knipowitschia caucasica TaxID=637954 RepID=A0AAV2MPA7_KNICA